MDWVDVGKTVKKYAPVLGTVIGGPVGGAIGGAVSLITSLFGIEDEEPTPEKVIEAIKADPQAAAKLRKLEMDHITELRKLALESDRMFLGDTADARDREIQVTKATGRREVNLYILAWIVVAGFFALCAVLFFKILPQGSSEIVFMLFGALSAGFGQVLQYFFGSSKASAEKTRLLSLRSEKK